MFIQKIGATWSAFLLLGLFVFVAAGCTGMEQIDTESAIDGSDGHTGTESHAEGIAHADELSPIDLAGGQQLRVVASTNIVADVVAQVGGDRIALTPLIPIGADPHSYQPRPDDLRMLDDADLLFINGLGLEEALMPIIEGLDETPVVSVNETVSVRMMDDEQHGQGDHMNEEHMDEEHADGEHMDEEHSHEEHVEEHAHDHGGVDPHSWMDVANVLAWVDTIETAFRTLDPAHADQYAANAHAYRTELSALDAELRSLFDTISPERRQLVTDHQSFGYFADAYGFDVIGAVIPGLSTLASPSAQQLGALQDQMRVLDLPAVFVGTTVNPELATRLAGDLGIQVVPIYTGSLSVEDGPAASYLDFMRHNAMVLAEALATD